MLPLLRSVTPSAVLVPVCFVPNARVAGSKASTACWLCPVSAAVLVPACVGTVSVPVWPVRPEAVNRTAIVQVWPTAREEAQVPPTTLKPAPVTVGVPTEIGPTPALVRTALTSLEAPAATLPKEAAAKVAAGAWPAAESATVRSKP